MQESKSDLIEREIQSISLVLRSILQKIIGSKGELPSFNETILMNQIEIEFDMLIKSKFEDFQNIMSSFNFSQKEILLDILNEMYCNSAIDEMKDEFKQKIIYLLDSLELETKTFSIHRLKIRDNL